MSETYRFDASAAYSSGETSTVFEHELSELFGARVISASGSVAQEFAAMLLLKAIRLLSAKDLELARTYSKRALEALEGGMFFDPMSLHWDADVLSKLRELAERISADPMEMYIWFYASQDSEGLYKLGRSEPFKVNQYEFVRESGASKQDHSQWSGILKSARLRAPSERLFASDPESLSIYFAHDVIKTGQAEEGADLEEFNLAMERGVAYKMSVIESEEMLLAESLRYPDADIRTLTDEALREVRESRHILGLPSPLVRGVYFYPAWQFSYSRALFREVFQVLKELPEWTSWHFFHYPRAFLYDASPLDLLRLKAQDDGSEVVSLLEDRHGSVEDAIVASAKDYIFGND